MADLRDRADRDDAGAFAAEPEVRRGRGFSPIWLVPLVALAIGGWLAYRAFVDQGPLVDIAFDTAEGIEAGKTQVRFKDVVVGSVESLRIATGLTGVVVAARLDKSFEPYVTDRASFWIVRPRIGAGGVSGLGTLLSGAYVEIDTQPGGTPKRHFDGVEEPPLIRSTVPGTRFVLTSRDLGAVSRGSPVLYDGVQVGEVLGYELNDEGGVTQHVFVRAPHDGLVKVGTRFWNAGGVRVGIGANGQPELTIPPLQALLIGGVEFGLTPEEAGSERAADGSSFVLYESRALAQQRHAAFTQPFILYFDGSLRGLNPGAAVEFRGIRIGRVRSIRLAYDAASDTLRIPVIIELESQDQVAARAGERSSPALMLDTVGEWVDRGLRARVETGNLLTGELIVTLGFYPDAAPAELGRSEGLPELPTIPSQIDEVTASLTGLLKRVAELPIEQIANDVRNSVQALAKAANSPELQRGLAGLGPAMDNVERTLARLDKIAATVERDTPGVLDAAKNAADAATRLMQQARTAVDSANAMLGPNSSVRYDLADALKQLAASARSIREFADYLARQPDALLRGRQSR